MHRIRLGGVLLALLISSFVIDRVHGDDPVEFRVMAWNILHGGRDDGEVIGPQRVVEIIRDSGADIIAMQETYGSGEQIAQALKFHFHPRGTNVSLLSRYPVVEDVSVFEEFKCVGAIFELPNQQRIAVYSIWLPYAAEIWEAGTRDIRQPEKMLEACQPSQADLVRIHELIRQRLKSPDYAEVPVIIAGDFNSMSHLDYLPSSQHQYGVSVDWPTSQVLTDAGFHDSWRELHPEVDRKTDRTWSPRFPDQEQDRIDYIYYRGEPLLPVESKLIDTFEPKFPSDHAAVVTRFAWSTYAAESQALRTVSYNIRHAQGNDNMVDLGRTAALLSNLRPDIVGLQEVDNRASRSGSVDQARLLGERLKMESAFGSFMDFQGGQYGLAILSRFPISQTEEIRLPDGNEPRVALAATVTLPDGQSLVVVNVHFDWVEDDGFRFAQAQVVADYLAKLKTPYLLLGDFNDQPGSRTLELLSANVTLAKKPSDDRMTHSSIQPNIEIDFIMGYPKHRWQSAFCKVMNGRVTSDHRPVFSIMELKNPVANQ